MFMMTVSIVNSVNLRFYLFVFASFHLPVYSYIRVEN